jgi:hypothetical protein
VRAGDHPQPNREVEGSTQKQVRIVVGGGGPGVVGQGSDVGPHLAAFDGSPLDFRQFLAGQERRDDDGEFRAGRRRDEREERRVPLLDPVDVEVSKETLSACSTRPSTVTGRVVGPMLLL